MQLTLNTVGLMCGGDLSANADPDLIIRDVVIDSREAKPGSLFVAIIGENLDGHDYVEAAFANGASAALVHLRYAGRNAQPLTPEERRASTRIPRGVIYVEDTVKALGLLARSYRQQFNIPIVGITGSNGKTTTKEMLKSICNQEFGEQHVLATAGNLNNHLGLPLTLLKLNDEHKVAIIEMGMNHAGELDYLTNIAKPTIAVVGNVMLAHAGFFNDINDIAKAKGEIYHGLVDDGIACVNLTVVEHDMWLQDLHNKKVKVVPYGTEQSGYYIQSDINMDSSLPHESDRQNDNAHNAFTLVTPLGSAKIELQILGKHNQSNALTAATLAINMGCSLKSIIVGLSMYTGYKGRLERKKAFNGALIIDDTYNANPESVKAAILAIQNLPKPHWFIFADLKELGKFANDAHKEIGEFAATHGIDLLLTYGELANTAGDMFTGEQLHFKTREDIVEYCLHNLPAPATLLLKGSNSMGLDKVVAGLM